MTSGLPSAKRNGAGRSKGCYAAADFFCGAASASKSHVDTTVSGLRDRLSMLCSISQLARSGWSEGPCPQIPTYLPCLRQARIAMASMAFTAASRSSKLSATRPESRSSPSVSWVRSLEQIEKLLGQDGVRRQLAHHHHAQAVRASSQAVFFQQVHHLFRLAERAYERHLQLDVRQAELVAHLPQRRAFQLEALAEAGRDVARGAAEAEHRVFLVGLVALAAEQLLVLVRLEIGQPHDHRLRPEGGRNGGDAFHHLLAEEAARVGVATAFFSQFLLQ